MQPESKKRSPWFYVAIGCGGLLVLGIVVLGLGILFAVNKAQEFQADMANPVTRDEKAKKVLGASKLPNGYFAVMTLSVPLVMDSAVLSTRPPDAPPHLRGAEQRVFAYVHVKNSTPSDAEQLRAYLEGRTDDPSVLTRNNIRIQPTERIGRGALDLDGRPAAYLAQRGELEGTVRQDQGPTVNAIVLFECPQSSTIRLGMWMVPDPAPESPLSKLDLQGTPADEKALRAFMSHFNPCQES